jgi:hypothetical protein
MLGGKAGGPLGVVFLLIGAILLGASLFAPWYYYHGEAGTWSGPDPTGTLTGSAAFFLMPQPGGGEVSYSCPSNAIPAFCTASSSYSVAGLNTTALVVGLALALTATGLIAGAVGGVLGMILRDKSRWATRVAILALLALALSVAATGSFTGLLPGAFAKDIPAAAQHSFQPSGPWSSFYGSSPLYINGPCCVAPTASWGPATGWYLSIAAIAALLVGAVLLVRFRHDLAQLTPSSMPPEPTHAPGAPKSTT